jgi:hypothetical protein
MFYIDKIEQVLFAVVVIYIISIIYSDSRIIGTSSIFALILPQLDEAIFNGNVLMSMVLGSALVYLSLN